MTFVYGDIDWMDPSTTKTLIANQEIIARLHILKNADHNLFIDNPKGLLDILFKELIEDK